MNHEPKNAWNSSLEDTYEKDVGKEASTQNTINIRHGKRGVLQNLDMSLKICHWRQSLWRETDRCICLEKSCHGKKGVLQDLDMSLKICLWETDSRICLINSWNGCHGKWESSQKTQSLTKKNYLYAHVGWMHREVPDAGLFCNGDVGLFADTVVQQKICRI